MKLKVEKIPWFLTFRGLLGQKSKPIYFTTRFGIHTFGMKYPIDVVILDRKGIVQKIKPNLKPNRIFLWNPLFDTILELPIGTVRKQKVRLGVRIALKSF